MNAKIAWSTPLYLMSLSALVGSCVVAPVDFAGKTCAADEDCNGLSCVEGLCRRAAAASDAGTVEHDAGRVRPDGGTPDAGHDEPDAGDDDAGRYDAGSEEDDAGRWDAGEGDGDAGHVDGGAPDPDDGGGTAVDAGPLDAGLLDAGPASWPAPAFAHAQRLSLHAPDELVPEGALIRVPLGDTASLIAAQKARVDGDDLRLWHFDGVWKELPRALHRAGDAGGWRGSASGPPIVMTRAARDIPLGGTDDDYWLLYGNPDAGAPPTEGVPAERVLASEGAATTQTSTTPLNVVGLTLSPSSNEEIWIVMATWNQRFEEPGGTAVSLPTGVARLVLDGTPSVALSGRGDRHRPRAMVALAVVRGHEAPLNVVLDFAATDEGVPVRIEQPRLLAFVLPIGANDATLRAGTEPVSYDEGVVGDTVTLLESDAAALGGNGLWLAGGAVRNGRAVFLLDEVQQRQQQDTLLSGSAAFQPFAHVGIIHLDAPRNTKIDLELSSGAQSHVAGLLSAVLPLSGFAWQQTFDISSQSTIADELTPILSHTLMATTLPHERVTLAMATVARVASSYDAVVARVITEGTELNREELVVNGPYRAPLAAVFHEDAAVSREFRLEAFSENIGVSTFLEHASFITLSYPEVATTPIDEEEAAP